MNLEDAYLLIRQLSDVPLASFGGIKLTGLDLQTLLPDGKLNDQVSQFSVVIFFPVTQLVYTKNMRKFQTPHSSIRKNKSGE